MIYLVIKNKIKYITAFVILISTFSCQQISNAAQWSGEFGLEARLFTQNAAYADQHDHNGSVTLQPELYHEFDSGNQSITFVPYIRYDQHDNERTHTDIRELTWVSVEDNIEWRIGLRKVFWGVAESQHLVDIINQTDAVDSPDGEEKLGQPMLNMSYISSIGTFDAFILPYFRERTFAGKNGRLRSEPYVDTSIVFYESNDKENNIDYALRWTNSIDEWDIGLSYFNGTSRDPRFILSKDSDGLSTLHPFYDLIEQYGIDVQATFDSWLWKLESIHRSGLGGSDDSNFNAVVAGFEYTFYSVIGEATDIGLVLEYLRDDRGNAAITPFQKDFLLGLRFNLNDEQSTDALFGIIKDIDSSATVYSIEFNRRLTEYLKLSIEARQYKNIVNTDVLHSNLKDDYVQFELKYFF